MSSDCIFCAIAAGTIPSEQVLADDGFVAFRDIDPKADTHVVVVPRAHHSDLDEWVRSGESSDAMFDFVERTARELRVDGRYRLITNIGPAAGQTVFHLHWHLLAGATLPGFG